MRRAILRPLINRPKHFLRFRIHQKNRSASPRETGNLRLIVPRSQWRHGAGSGRNNGRRHNMVQPILESRAQLIREYRIRKLRIRNHLEHMPARNAIRQQLIEPAAHRIHVHRFHIFQLRARYRQRE